MEGRAKQCQPSQTAQKDVFPNEYRNWKKAFGERENYGKNVNIPNMFWIKYLCYLIKNLIQWNRSAEDEFIYSFGRWGTGSIEMREINSLSQKQPISPEFMAIGWEITRNLLPLSLSIIKRGRQQKFKIVARQ
jgi:hypothetical protein